jgi:glyoxylase-like metal-dependent hydrolase (beta-lactamase superfamily II)
MIEKIIENIYRIEVKLPNSPLGSLNSYVIKGKDRNLLIDTGFNRIECLESLQLGLKELDVSMDNTDIFLTHLHADHSGLVSKIASPNTKIYMSDVDKEILDKQLLESDIFWSETDEMGKREGVPAEILDLATRENPGKKYATDRNFEHISIKEGSQIRVDDNVLTCVSSPGHTPGHMCLYLENKKVMFLGDTVLFGISPNITVWIGYSNPLAQYLESLEKIKGYSVDFPLVGHRKIEGNLSQRAEELIAHHEMRLLEIESIIAETPGITSYEVASKMKWSIRTLNWQTFPLEQKWFAVAEALAHLEYLDNAGRVKKILENGVYCCYKQND